MTANTIVSLAMLKANWDLASDYLDSFIPFVAESIRLCGNKPVNLGDTQNKLVEEFGIDLPQHVINLMLKRLERSGQIRLEHGIYVLDEHSVHNTDFESRRAEFTRMQTALLSDIVKFAKEKYTTEILPEAAETALLGFLEQNNQFVFVLKAQIRGSVIPAIPDGNASTTTYIVAKYIEYVEANKPEEFKYLETIVKGLMYSNIIFLPQNIEVYAPFTNTKVFIDTPLLMLALGYSGSSLQAPCVELIQLLKNAKAEICCFEHSILEGTRLLDSHAKTIGSPNPNGFLPTVEYFRSQRYTPSDVLELSVNFGDNVRNLGVTVAAKPVTRADGLAIDEEKLAEDLKPYNVERALIHDVVSIASIYRLREGKEYYNIENCVALFVTNNTRLVSRVRKHFSDEFNENSVMLAMADQTLTNLVWLKNPSQSPTLARKRLMANCYAAIQPSEKMWTKFLEYFDVLQASGELDNDKYYALRNATVTKSALMDVLVGDEEAFTQGTAQEVIDRAMQNLRASDLKKLEVATLKTGELEAQLSRDKARREERARAYAMMVTTIVKISYVLLATVVTVIAIPFDFTPLELIPDVTLEVRWIAFVVMLVIIGASLLELGKGIKLFRYGISDVFDWLYSKVYKRRLDFLNR